MSSTQAGFNQYKNEDSGIEIQYPADWKVRTASGGVGQCDNQSIFRYMYCASFRPIKHSTLIEYASVNISELGKEGSNLPQAMTLEEFMKKSIEHWQFSYPKLTVDEFDTTKYKLSGHN